MRFRAALLLCLCSFAASGHAAPVNVATLTCARYQNEIVGPAAAPGTDSINTVMWLFGYSVGKSGAQVMYGDALAGFGFALDAECKNNPAESVLDALARVKPDAKNPMDLSMLECETFASRHLELVKSDRESADTIMMWLYGFAVAKSGSHMLDPGGLAGFEGALMADCRKSPGRSLADELSAVKFPAPKS
jgi:hypothetical protein